MSKRATLFLALILAAAVSCVKHEALFEGKTVVYDDGSFSRSASLNIVRSDGTAGVPDSTEAIKFLEEHFPPIDRSLFEVHTLFSEGVLTVTWSGMFSSDDLPLNDYNHRMGEGTAATNRIEIDVNNRWFYKDFRYLEVFSDPVDAGKYFDIIEKGLSDASDRILASTSLSGLRDREEADKILSGLREKTGVNLLKMLLENPRILDSLSERYDSYFEIAGDSLAGLAGVKLSPESASELIEEQFGAVWDTIMTDHPGIFGSYGLAEGGHKFRIEVFLPGCVRSGNADSTFESMAVWYFDNLDFFAREKSLELTARDWVWGNVVIAAVAIILVLLFALWPLRRGKMVKP